MASEYRVIWKREGMRTKRFRSVSRAAAERRLALMTSPEPWKFYNPPKEGDQQICCSGHECGCFGATYREEAEAKYKEMPKLEWIRLEAREVGKWASSQSAASHADKEIK